MKTDLTHLPKEKLEELNLVTNIIRDAADTGLIILFGSYARGDWVSDRYKEGHITYEYISDYDILVVVKGEKLSKNFGLWNDVEQKIKTSSVIKTPVSLVIDTIHFVNEKLKEGNYFYIDIKNEGLILYDSGEYNLAEPKKLTAPEVSANAKRDFDFWFKKSQSFLKDFNHNIEDKELNNAAFHLHQVAETLYVATLLVFTGYKPKTHNLEKLRSLVIQETKNLEDIFKVRSQEDRAIFDKLVRAYVDARYRPDYEITLEELEYLAERISELEKAVHSTCLDKITSLDSK